MKKDRNCGATPYPVYPNYNGMMGPNVMGGMSPMPGYGTMMPMPQPISAPTFVSSGSCCSNNNEELNRMREQIQNLDRRVSRLESMVNNKTTSFGSNQYTDSNYHVM